MQRGLVVPEEGEQVGHGENVELACAANDRSAARIQNFAETFRSTSAPRLRIKNMHLEGTVKFDYGPGDGPAGAG